MQIGKEYIEKIKGADSVEELKKICAEDNINVSDEKLKQYFDMYHSGSAELSDDELDNVAGGACYSDGVDGPHGFRRYLITTVCNSCGWHSSMEESTTNICGNCDHAFGVGLTMYCGATVLEDDGNEWIIL